MSDQSFFYQSVEFLTGVGPQRAETLTKEFNIRRYKDLIIYYPVR